MKEFNDGCFKPQYYLKNRSELKKKNVIRFDFVFGGLFSVFFLGF
jgi:hypothetical protein